MADAVANTSLVPISGGARSGNASLTAMLAPLRGLVGQPAVARALPAIAVVGVVIVAILAWSMLTTSTARSVYAGGNDADRAAIADALGTAQIPFTVDSGSGAITVPDDQYHSARMLIAGQGLPRSVDAGPDALSAIPMGSSRAIEDERIRGAREADLARTIEQIDMVERARLHIAAGAPSVFVRNNGAPAASVMLRLAPGRALAQAQVQAIIHLVAASVPNLAADNVSVIDQSGRLLSRADGDGAGGASERQIAMQDAIEDRYRRAVVAMLTPLVGADNFTAEVHAEVDFSEVQSTREGFPEDGRVLRSEEGALSTESSAGAAPAGGIPGALANQPPPPAVASATPPATIPPANATAAVGADGGRRTENYTRNFAISREVSVTRQQTPVIRRVTVAVALRTPARGAARSAADVRGIEALIKSAVGFDQTRGDVVTVGSRAFAPAPVANAGWFDAAWVTPAMRYGTGLIIALIIIFVLLRPMMKRLGERPGSSAAAAPPLFNPAPASPSLAAAIADEAARDPNAKVSLEMIEAVQDYEVRAALIRNFVKQDPERAALVVRDLIRGTEARNG
jgi:flagellar M-ring protein FliF